MNNGWTPEVRTSGKASGSTMPSAPGAATVGKDSSHSPTSEAKSSKGNRKGKGDAGVSPPGGKPKTAGDHRTGDLVHPFATPAANTGKWELRQGDFDTPITTSQEFEENLEHAPRDVILKAIVYAETEHDALVTQAAIWEFNDLRAAVKVIFRDKKGDATFVGKRQDGTTCCQRATVIDIVQGVDVQDAHLPRCLLPTADSLTMVDVKAHLHSTKAKDYTLMRVLVDSRFFSTEEWKKYAVSPNKLIMRQINKLPLHLTADVDSVRFRDEEWDDDKTHHSRYVASCLVRGNFDEELSQTPGKLLGVQGKFGLWFEPLSWTKDPGLPPFTTIPAPRRIPGQSLQEYIDGIHDAQELPMGITRGKKIFPKEKDQRL